MIRGGLALVAALFGEELVKLCRGGGMALRWVATGALEHAKKFRRLEGHKEMPKLVAALRARDAEMKNANVRRTGWKSHGRCRREFQLRAGQTPRLELGVWEI
jgi:hypothetical protein